MSSIEGAAAAAAEAIATGAATAAMVAFETASMAWAAEGAVADAETAGATAVGMAGRLGIEIEIGSEGIDGVAMDAVADPIAIDADTSALALELQYQIK